MVWWFWERLYCFLIDTTNIFSSCDEAQFFLDQLLVTSLRADWRCGHCEWRVELAIGLEFGLEHESWPGFSSFKCCSQGMCIPFFRFLETADSLNSASIRPRMKNILQYIDFEYILNFTWIFVLRLLNIDCETYRHTHTHTCIRMYILHRYTITSAELGKGTGMDSFSTASMVFNSDQGATRQPWPYHSYDPTFLVQRPWIMKQNTAIGTETSKSF